MVRIALIVSLLACASCVSSSSSSFQSDHGTCQPRPELAGEWQSRRGSQLGRAAVTITLDCDCRYSLKISSWLVRIRERGEYRVDHDRIVFSRSSAETTWPFQYADGHLQLTEAAGETYEYRRTKAGNCDAAKVDQPSRGCSRVRAEVY